MRDPLTQETRALLDLARDGDEPTAGDRARLRRAVMLAVTGGAATGASAIGAGTAAASVAEIPAAVVGGAAVASSSAVGAAVASSSAVGGAVVAGSAVTTASVAGMTGLGAVLAKAMLAVVAVGAVSLGVLVGPSDTAPDPAASSASSAVPAQTAAAAVGEGRAPAAPAAVVTAVDGPAEEAAPHSVTTAPPEDVRAPGPVPASDPVSVPARRRALAPSPAPASPSLSIRAEVLLLRRADAARLGGDPAAALALTEAHARRFPTGVLAPERDAARVLSLCDLGRVAEGEEAGERFVRDHPSSPLLGRVQAACR